MAEVVADRVCEKFGTVRECRTHLELLPDLHKEPRTTSGHYYLGSRLARTEKDKKYGELVCECELVLQEDVEHAILQGGAKTFDDIRRDVRLGMGPCQGASAPIGRRVSGIPCAKDRLRRQTLRCVTSCKSAGKG